MVSSSRPSRLLNLNKSPIAMKAIAATNATTSPLLILPAEIRARIYKFALGGKTLHVGCPGDRSLLVACAHTEDYDMTPTQYSKWPYIKDDTSHRFQMVSDDTLDFFRQFYVEPHDECFRTTLAKQGYSLNLLGVCRQIYHEAVLIPFQANTFVDGCGNEPNLQEFLDVLVPAQARAITHLVCTISCFHRPSACYIQRLRGLRTLQYILFSSGPYETYERNFEYAELNMLDLKDLQKVHIEVRRVMRAKYEVDYDDPAKVTEWIKRAERMILE